MASKTAAEYLKELEALKLPADAYLRIAATARYLGAEAGIHTFKKGLENPICLPLNSKQRVLPGEECPIFLTPDVTYLPQRLAVDPECAPFFGVLWHKASNIVTIGAGVSAPEAEHRDAYKGTLFPPIPDYPQTEESRVAHQALVHFYPMMTPANRMTLMVRNEGSAPRHFRGCLWGFYCLGGVDV